MWDRHYSSGNIPWREKEPDLSGVCERVTGGTALDLGCGTGEYAKTLFRRGFLVDAVDFSEEALVIARRENPGPRYFVGDVENLGAIPSLKNVYDVAIDVRTLAFMQNKENYVQNVAGMVTKLFYIKTFTRHFKKPAITINTRILRPLLEKHFAYVEEKRTDYQSAAEVEFFCLPGGSSDFPTARVKWENDQAGGKRSH